MTRAVLLFLAAVLSASCGCAEPRDPRVRTKPPGAYDIRTPDGTQLQLQETSDGETTVLVARTAQTGSVREIDLGDLRELTDAALLPEVAEEETLELWCSGYRPLALPVPAPREPLVLVPGIPVRLRVESPGALPSDGHELHLHLRWRGAGDLPEALLLSRFDDVAPAGWKPGDPDDGRDLKIVVTAEHPEVELRASFPGRHRVSWILSRVTRGEGTYVSHGIGLPDAGGNVVLTEGGAEPPVVTLRIPEAQLEDAFASLSR